MSGRPEDILRMLGDWPGKSARDGGDEHPAAYHMLDVAAVAERLLGPSPLPQPVKEALALLIGLHDLGKISASFRAMIQDQEPQSWRHWELTEAFLWENAILRDRLQAQSKALPHLISAIAGHHGCPSPQLDKHFADKAAQASPDVATLVAAFCGLWPTASLASLDRRQAGALGWWLAGLTTAADWVGSNTDWFPARKPDLGLAAYLALARGQAAVAVEQSGLSGASTRAETLFTFPLRPMQAAARDISLPDGPTLAFIEDETGAGKTEAALILAQRMLLAGKGRGLYFALPTMATADAMFSRAEKVMGKLFDRPSLTLAHGRAGLSDSFRRVIGGATESDDITCAPWLADNRRRALLADVGIGTIDQALLAVLRARFSALRLWGLSSKILIVDEVHAISGDGYMSEVLERLLSAHAAQGGSAILMTATLPLQARANLTRAFAAGAGRDWPDDLDRAYPALSIAGGAARRGFSEVASPKGPVRVERLATTDRALDVLAAAAAQGAACVWIRNAVDEAIAAREALKERGIAASLLHARFALTDRKRIEKAELARFGRDGMDRAGQVLVGTQVVEASLDLDFDVMISDLAPMASLVQRAGRLWRHMDLRPAESRPVAAPVLHVLSPDPASVTDTRWLLDCLGAGGWVYPVDQQWRTAERLFRAGAITAPEGLRDLIEAVHSDTLPVPKALEGAEEERIGMGYAQRNLAANNVIGWTDGYRQGASRADDTAYPTRLGPEAATLVLARWREGRLVPWAEDDSRRADEPWMLSEVSADKRKLDQLPLPDQTQPAIAAVTKDWPEWHRASVRLCPVGDDGTICEGLIYSETLGLIFSSPHVRG